MSYAGYKYQTLDQFLANSAMQGGGGAGNWAPGQPQSYAQDDGSGQIVERTNPYFGLDQAGIGQKFLSQQGMNPQQYIDSINAKFNPSSRDYDASRQLALSSDGKSVRLNNYLDAPDPSGTAMMAILTAIFGGAGAIAGGAAEGIGASALSSAGTGLEAAEAGYAGAGGYGGGLYSGATGLEGAEAGGFNAGSDWYGNGGAMNGGNLEYGDYGYSDTGFGGDSPVNYNDFVGDIPTTNGGGTSIYGNNPSVSDLMSQYKLSGQNPVDFVKNLTGMPNLPPGLSQALKALTGSGDNNGLAKILGQLAATGLGIYGANRQAGQIGTLAQQYAGYGAPYRAMLEQSYADPASFLKNSPDIQASVNQGTDALARSLSTQGNPTGNGNSLQQLQNYATQGLYGQLGNQRNQLANFGGLSNFNAAAPGLAGQAITAGGGALNAIGSGISAITNPPTTLEQALNAMNSNNFKMGNGAQL